MRTIKNKPVTEYYIISDLDDTILGSDHACSFDNKKALNEYLAAGGHFGIASGRGEISVRRLEIPTNIPSILYNGTVLYDLNTDKVLWCAHLPEGIQDFTEKLMKHFPELSAEIVTLKGTYVYKKNAECQKHLDLEHIHPKLETSDYEKIRTIPEQWLKIMLEWSNEGLLKVRDYLDAQTALGEINLQYAFSLPFIIEVTQAGIHKGTALSHLTSHLGITVDDVIAIGDNMNDMGMLTAAGTAIVPSSGVPEAKAVADYICVSCDEHVLKDVLKL